METMFFAILFEGFILVLKLKQTKFLNHNSLRNYYLSLLMMTVNQVEMHLINIQDFNLITYLQLQLRKPFNMTSLNEY